MADFDTKSPRFKVRARRATVERLVAEVVEAHEVLFSMDVLRDWLKRRGVDLEIIGCDLKAEAREYEAHLRRMHG